MPKCRTMGSEPSSHKGRSLALRQVSWGIRPQAVASGARTPTGRVRDRDQLSPAEPVSDSDNDASARVAALVRGDRVPAAQPVGVAPLSVLSSTHRGCRRYNLDRLTCGRCCSGSRVVLKAQAYKEALVKNLSIHLLLSEAIPRMYNLGSAGQNNVVSANNQTVVLPGGTYTALQLLARVCLWSQERHLHGPLLRWDVFNVHPVVQRLGRQLLGAGGKRRGVDGLS